MSRFSKYLSALGVLAVLTAILAVPAEAQLCLGPDGLTGPCCSAATITVPPPLPGASLPSAGVCWIGCSPSTSSIFITCSPPAQIWCGSYQAQLSVDDASGVSILSGLLELDYSRTWTEFNDDGDELQVWRMLAKTDMRASGTSGACPVPACLATGATAFFYGHIDYAYNCSTTNWEVAISLFHPGDLFIHNPASSSIPGPYHATRSYALVGPDLPANPFSPTLLPPVTGAVTGGAVRRVAPPGAACAFEEPLTSGNLWTFQQGCACPLNPAPLQYSAQPFWANSSCGSGFLSLWTPAPHWWRRMITISLGTWTGSGPGTPYPGDENLWANEVVFSYTDGCSSTTRIELHYGVMTDQGFAVVPDTQRPYQTMRMIDLASNFTAAGGLVPPYVGSVVRTTHVVHANF
jgi:hypothetical protein